MPGGGRRWKTLVSQLRGLRSTSSFPPSPTALGNRQKRDFHIPTPPTMILLFSLPPKPLAPAAFVCQISDPWEDRGARVVARPGKRRIADPQQVGLFCS